MNLVAAIVQLVFPLIFRPIATGVPGDPVSHVIETDRRRRDEYMQAPERAVYSIQIVGTEQP